MTISGRFKAILLAAFPLLLVLPPLATQPALPTRAQSWGVVIERFESAQDTTATSDSPDVTSSTSGTDMIGDYRNFRVEWYTGGDVRARSGYPEYHLIHEQEPFTRGRITITWDGNNEPNALDPTGLGGVDLTAGGMADRFYVLGVSCDLDATVKFRCYTDGANYEDALLNVPEGTSNQMLELPFSSFGGGMGTWDPTHTGAIVVEINRWDPEAPGPLALTIDLIATGNPPTAVELTSFTAAWDGDVVPVALGLVFVFGIAAVGAALARRR